MKNVEVQPALDALVKLSTTKLPISVALEVVRERKQLELLITEYETVRNEVVMRLMKYEKEGEEVTEELTPTHPNFVLASIELGQLMESENRHQPMTLQLHVRSTEGSEEYSWDPTFNTIIESLDADLLYGLMHFLDVKYAT